MKANEAPEKLYIALNELDEDERTFVLDHRVDYPICTEYTCIDAFIEKACDYLSYHLDTSKIDVNYKFDFIEEFRNYMKGVKYEP